MKTLAKMSAVVLLGSFMAACTADSSESSSSSAAAASDPAWSTKPFTSFAAPELEDVRVKFLELLHRHFPDMALWVDATAYPEALTIDQALRGELYNGDYATSYLMVQPQEADGPRKEIRGIIADFFPDYTFTDGDPVSNDPDFKAVDAAQQSLQRVLPHECDDGANGVLPCDANGKRIPAHRFLMFRGAGKGDRFLIVDPTNHQALSLVITRSKWP
jgi:hypothetical protein